VGLVLALVLFVRPAAAEEVAVPVGLQAELLAKVAGYDKNLPARAGDKVHVLIVTKPGDADSTSVAAHMDRSLRAISEIGGLPHDETTTAYESPEALAKTIRSSRISIVYLTPGFRDDAEAIARALTGVNVLSVGALADYVPKGVVLGFDLVSGKPKMVIHLAQARRQEVAFRAEVLKLAKVLE
jgi:hypothetical protein